MILSDPKNTTQTTRPTNEVEDLEQSSMQGGAELDQSYKDEPSSSIQFDIYEFGCEYTIRLNSLLKICLRHDFLKS